MVKYSNMKSNLYNKTYSNIPLSVLYKQFIRFMKENEIYALYLEISFPKTKMSYKTFSKNIFSQYKCYKKSIFPSHNPKPDYKTLWECLLT